MIKIYRLYLFDTNHLFLIFVYTYLFHIYVYFNSNKDFSVHKMVVQIHRIRLKEVINFRFLKIKDVILKQIKILISKDDDNFDMVVFKNNSNCINTIQDFYDFIDHNVVIITYIRDRYFVKIYFSIRIKVKKILDEVRIYNFFINFDVFYIRKVYVFEKIFIQVVREDSLRLHNLSKVH